MKSSRLIRKLLIANRGEIALRVIRAAKVLGIRTALAHSDTDAGSLAWREADETVPIDPGGPPRCYLEIAKVVAAARKAGCDAVHPGYGFLSENAAFAQALSDAGLVFVGPSPETMRLAGDKLAARQAARRAGVPTTPGSDGPVDRDGLAPAARKVGFPLFLKAAGGGGGKGIRLVHRMKDLESAFDMASEEARKAFADPTVYIERRIHPARHVEVQIFADQAGKTVALGERECSVQRRHQKLIEESPSPACTPRLRAALLRAAVRIARACRYTGAGTVEFLIDGRGRFYFMEVNARIQVEHPVTEMVTGLDLVQAQLLVASGHPLPFRQEDLAPRGHAIEARVQAEDPFADFIPSTGKIRALHLPGGPGLRIDTALAPDLDITPHYDSLLAKVIAWAPTRREAALKLAAALDELSIRGVLTTAPFLAELARSGAFLSGKISTDFLDRWKPREPGRRALAAAALAAVLSKTSPADLGEAAPAGRPDPWNQTGKQEGLRSGIFRPHLWKNT